jgi:hypothetical protein
VNGKLWLAFQLALVGQRLEPEEDFLVAVEGIDDQTQQLVDLRLCFQLVFRFTGSATGATAFGSIA